MQQPGAAEDGAPTHGGSLPMNNQPSGERPGKQKQGGRERCQWRFVIPNKGMEIIRYFSSVAGALGSSPAGVGGEMLPWALVRVVHGGFADTYITRVWFDPACQCCADISNSATSSPRNNISQRAADATGQQEKAIHIVFVNLVSL